MLFLDLPDSNYLTNVITIEPKTIGIAAVTHNP